MANGVSMENVFEQAHAHVAKWEGGFFEHPNDPGGITNCGVSLMFLKGLGLVEGDIDGDGDIDRDDVLAITKDTAREIFRRHFWDKPGASALPPLVAAAYYDFAVNAGCGRAAIVLQQAINVILPGSIQKLAGNLGPLTRKYSARIAAQEASGELQLAISYIFVREEWYRRLVKARPTSAVFLKGWLNRSLECQKLVVSLAKQGGVQ